MAKSENIQLAVKSAPEAGLLKVRVRQRRGLRYLKVTVNNFGEVALNVPYGVSRKAAMQFLDEQSEWISQTVKKASPAPMLATHLERHPWISAYGRSYEVRLCPSRVGGFCLDHHHRTVALNNDEEVGEEAVLLQSLRAFAKEHIPPHVEALAKRRKLDFSRISVRDQRSRWGSCSERGTLSFNWRILLLAPAVHDYLIWHELAHLVELNHSDAYWTQLGKLDPEWEQNDAALSEESALLMRLGRLN
jgi:hypothetical protein